MMIHPRRLVDLPHMLDDLHAIEREVYGVGNEPSEGDDVTFQTYSLQIIGPLSNTWDAVDTWKRVAANLPAIVEATEEDITDLLPDGYRARIVAWDEED